MHALPHVRLVSCPVLSCLLFLPPIRPHRAPEPKMCIQGVSLAPFHVSGNRHATTSLCFSAFPLSPNMQTQTSKQKHNKQSGSKRIESSLQKHTFSLTPPSAAMLCLVRGPGLGRVGLRDRRSGRHRRVAVVLGQGARGLGPPVVEAGPVM